MKTNTPIANLSAVFATLFAAFTLATPQFTQADTFGSGENTFTIDFVSIGNTDNADDVTGYGAVPYAYRMATYETSVNSITNAKALGMVGVSTVWAGNQPAGQVNWNEAAQFVNWLNTSKGYQAAYNLSYDGSIYTFNLWSAGQAWTLGGTNLYRHKDAVYFLPSEDEWYKAAYYDGGTSTYYNYATGSDTAPTAVASGTTADTAVYNQSFNPGPPATGVADVNVAGGLSPYGTMAQSGNLQEWMESAFDGTNSSPTENRVYRDGAFWDTIAPSYTNRVSSAPGSGGVNLGMRVASIEAIPEPSTYALLALSAAGLGAHVLRRK